jgi:hypothetical protein
MHESTLCLHCASSVPMQPRSCARPARSKCVTCQGCSRVCAKLQRRVLRGLCSQTLVSFSPHPQPCRPRRPSGRAMRMMTTPMVCTPAQHPQPRQLPHPSTQKIDSISLSLSLLLSCRCVRGRRREARGHTRCTGRWWWPDGAVLLCVRLCHRTACRCGRFRRSALVARSPLAPSSFGCVVFSLLLSFFLCGSVLLTRWHESDNLRNPPSALPQPLRQRSHASRDRRASTTVT